MPNTLMSLTLAGGEAIEIGTVFLVFFLTAIIFVYFSVLDNLN